MPPCNSQAYHDTQGSKNSTDTLASHSSKPSLRHTMRATNYGGRTHRRAEHSSPFTKNLPPEPWFDVLVKFPKRLSKKCNRQDPEAERRAATARTDRTQNSVFTATSWDPTTQRARLAVTSLIGTCRQIHEYDHKPSPNSTVHRPVHA